jgi:hypothetical protein
MNVFIWYSFLCIYSLFFISYPYLFLEMELSLFYEVMILSDQIIHIIFILSLELESQY